jgi:hypothetical protein
MKRMRRVFGGEFRAKVATEELYGQIGRLKMEVEWQPVAVCEAGFSDKREQCC